MGFLQRLSEMRNEQIMRKALPFLEEGEEVLHWARARHPEDGRHGVVFITRKRAVVSWSGRNDEDGHYPWVDFRTWGLSHSYRNGPVLCVQMQAEEETHLVQLAVTTHDMARNAANFLREFAELAPWPEQGPATNGKGAFEPQTAAEIYRSKRTPAEIFRRWGLTILGAALIIVGILIIPLPGPWSFILNIGGLAVLAREHDWAEDLLEWTKERFESAKKKVTERRRRKRSQA